MKKIYCINELTIVPMLLSALLRRPAWYLLVTPFLQRSRPVLVRLLRWCETRGARRADDLAPAIGPVLDYHYRALLVDFFARIEDWQHEYYGFGKPLPGIERYESCYKLVVSTHLGIMAPIIVSLGDIADALGDEVRVVGVPADIIAAAEAFSGRDFGGLARPGPNLSALFNPLLGIAIIAASMLWSLVRIRPRGVTRKDYFMIADYVDDMSDAMLYREVAEAGPMLLAGRTKAYGRQRHKFDLPAHDFCTIEDGLLDLRQGARVLGFLLRDGLRCLFRFRGLVTPLFYALIALPLYRAKYRAFFTRFGTRYFWGRDPFSPYHLIRRQEITRIGGLSWSVSHSYLALGDRFPEFAYIDYHRFYMMGTLMRDKWYKDTWSKDMEVVPSAPFRIPRDVFSRRRETKPKDILIMASVSLWHPRFEGLCRDIAEAFPDRTVYVQVKEVFRHLPLARQFIENVTAGLAHVKIHAGSPYEMFDHCRYIFSDPSTIALEPVTCGIAAFALDVEGLKNSVMHEVPGFCATTAEEAISRVRGIEDGSWRYPVLELSKVIDLSGLSFFDRVRMDFGLEPRENAFPAWPELDDRTDGIQAASAAGNS